MRPERGKNRRPHRDQRDQRGRRDRRDRPPPEQKPAEFESGERLQKVLASAGIGSRRECEQYILEGRVEVDGKVVTELGTRVDPFRQEIRVDGSRLPREQRTYIMLNKPTGVVTTNRDPSGRPRVIDLVPSPYRLFPVGRLDRSSEGLILLTNDGEFSNRIAHPRYEVEKTYRVLVAGQMEPQTIQRLLRGVHLAEGFARVLALRVKKSHKMSTELEIVLKEGKNREIRRVLARVGHKVLRLKRIAIGPLRLGEMPPGAHRPLTHQEVNALMRAASSTEQRRPGPRVGGPRTRGPAGQRPSAARTKPTAPPKKYGSVLGYDEPAPSSDREPKRKRRGFRASDVRKRRDKGKS